MSIKDKLKDFINPKISISIDSLGSPEIQLSFEKNIKIEDDELKKRINDLDKIKDELINASEAIDFIKKNALDKQTELVELKKNLENLEIQKKTTEGVLKLNQEAFTELLQLASKKGRTRNIIFGFISGVVSSGIVAFIFKIFS